ncbi:N-acetyltransferase [Vibrio sp. ZSDZ34]|jgi:predicted GNAT family acetyltransferase|uniref:N-acetyltransferase n=1 Tax=Vibrio gelatinilyticus TaxID=2893468 RepID=A0A9X1WBU2_9VIBR|nr:GNAT family N-acetyltransferase [Vibrio gelatinilyticus]MCJ2377688.1 N-acetyltransferase [Vibrio gelatinilyticus]
MIVHQKERQRFVIEKAGFECVLEYKLTDSGINFTRTFVPDVFRGQGLARQLVDAGLAWASEEQLDIEADCWYVAKILK